MKLNETHINNFVTLRSHRWGAVVTGVYLGIMDDEGEPYHYFRGGAVNGGLQIRPDGTEGMHGFPVSLAYDWKLLEVK